MVLGSGYEVRNINENKVTTLTLWPLGQKGQDFLSRPKLVKELDGYMLPPSGEKKIKILLENTNSI